MKSNSKILLILFVFIGVNQVDGQNIDPLNNSKEPNYQIDVFTDNTDVTLNYFTKWTGINKTTSATIGNSLLLYEMNGKINIGDSKITYPFDIFNVYGEVSVMNRIEFKSSAADLTWGNSSRPGYFNINARGQFGIKTIVALNGEDGFVGIGTTKPIALLETKTDDKNIPAFVTSSNYGNRLFMVPYLGGYGYNHLSKLGDAGLFWTDNEGVANNESGLIIAPHHNSSAGIRIDNNGNLGIGLNSPSAKLHVNGRTITKYFTLYDENQPPEGGYVLLSDIDGNARWSDPSGFGLWQQNSNDNDIYFNDGNVSIGTEESFVDYRLAVNGKIISEEILVKFYSDWPDFVFKEGFKLESLESVEAYIIDNKHLPGVPSATDVHDNGIKLGEMNAILLQKIEELTLYTIEQQKMIEKQSKILDKQHNQIEELINTVKNK